MATLFGIIFHAIGGFAAGSFYIPYSKIKNWAWEVYWLLGGFFAWIIMPWIFAYFTVPNLFELFNSLSIENLFWPYFFGILWGIGGLTFGLTMRYLGMSLGMSLALGLTAIFGTIIPPIYHDQINGLINATSGLITLSGVLITLFGIAIVGKAGLLKDKELSDEKKQESIKEFNFKKGILVAFFAGIMSACFAFGIDSGKVITEQAVKFGTSSLFSNNPAFILIMGGGFTTNLIWCLFLSIKNKTINQYYSSDNRPLKKNYFFSSLAGITWYFQFLFYGMGTTQMGKYDFASWSIHMAFVIVFSSAWGIFLKEWKGSSRKTLMVVLLGLFILVISVFIIGTGNYIQKFE